MTSLNNPKVPVRMQQLNLPVYRAPGHAIDGIAMAQMRNEVLITITSNGEAFYVRLRGQEIDNVAALMASCMDAATRFEHPSLGGVQ